MDKPWKVILAFVGVFIAGAVFGGLFTLGTSSRHLANEEAANRIVTTAPAVAPKAEPATVQTPTVTPPAPTPVAQTAPAQAPAPPNRIAPALMTQFTKRLSPTADQRKKIRVVVDRAAEDFQRMQREHL